MTFSYDTFNFPPGSSAGNSGNGSEVWRLGSAQLGQSRGNQSDISEIIRQATGQALIEFQNAAYLRLQIQLERQNIELDQLRADKLKLEHTITAINERCKTLEEINDKIIKQRNSSQAASGLPQPQQKPAPLDRQQYPEVHYWDKHEWTSEQRARRGETNGEATQQKRGRRVREDDPNFSNEPNTSHPYLETADGIPISQRQLSRLSQIARGLWFTALEAGKAPATWGQASSLLNDFYASSLLSHPELSFLQFCSGGWKLEHWTTFNYPSWAASQDLTSSDEGGKKKKNKKSNEVVVPPESCQTEGENTPNLGPLDTNSVPSIQTRQPGVQIHDPLSENNNEEDNHLDNRGTSNENENGAGNNNVNNNDSGPNNSENSSSGEGSEQQNGDPDTHPTPSPDDNEPNVQETPVIQPAGPTRKRRLREIQPPQKLSTMEPPTKARKTAQNPTASKSSQKNNELAIPGSANTDRQVVKNKAMRVWCRENPQGLKKTFDAYWKGLTNAQKKELANKPLSLGVGEVENN